MELWPALTPSVDSIINREQHIVLTGPEEKSVGNWIFVGIEIIVITCCYISF